MSDTVKKRKAPACDHCKAKRVLCHPSAQGCPRCLEKGIECTTTPVVRRKPARKKKYPGESTESSVEPTTAASGSTASAIPDPHTAPVPVETQAPPTFASFPLAPEALSTFPPDAPVVAVPPPPSAPASLAAYGLSPLPPTSFADSTSLPSHFLQPPVEPVPVASTSQVPYTSTAVILNSSSAPAGGRHLEHPPPQLVRHLLECFRNTSLWDHPIARYVNLQELLETAAFDLAQLDVQAHVCVYAVLTIGALVSYDPAIIGDGPGASSFKAMETLAGELEDLRQFGRRRRTAFETMRNHALKMAREADVLLEPSKLNAMSCALLDYLTGTSDVTPPSRPFLGGFMSHLRILYDSGELGDDEGPRTVWAMGLSHDMSTEIVSGRLTSTPADQLALVGALDIDLEAFEEQLRSWRPKPKLEDVMQASLRPLALAHLSICRELAGNILSTHARRQPLDEAALALFLKRLNRFRTISSLLVEHLDTLIELDERPLFPHATPRRIRHTSQMALRAIRGFAAMIGPIVVVPLYRELRRRLAEAQDAVRDTQGVEREERQGLVERLELVVRQFSKVFIRALRDIIESIERSPSILLTATLRKIGVVDWGSILLQEVEGGAIALDDDIVDLFEKVSNLAKISGYTYSSSNIDALIERLEAHVAVYRSPTSTQFATSTYPFAPLARHASTAAAARPFDFAFLSELSGSAENSPDATHPLGTTPAPVHGLSSATTAAAPASADVPMPFDLGLGFGPSALDPSSAPFGAQAMPAFSPEQLAQLLGANVGGGEGKGDLGAAADVFAGWAAW